MPDATELTQPLNVQHLTGAEGDIMVVRRRERKEAVMRLPKRSRRPFSIGLNFAFGLVHWILAALLLAGCSDGQQTASSDGQLNPGLGERSAWLEKVLLKHGTDPSAAGLQESLIEIRLDGCTLSWTQITRESDERFLREYEWRVQLRDLEYAAVAENGRRDGGPWLHSDNIMLPRSGPANREHAFERAWFTDANGNKEKLKYEGVPDVPTSLEIPYYGSEYTKQILDALDEAIRACGGRKARPGYTR